MNCFRIDLTALAPRTTTRSRGYEAFLKLEPLFKSHDCLELDLTRAEISASFLDEIVLKSAKMDALKSLVFVIDSAALCSKLERVFSMRHLHGKYRFSNDTIIREIEPKLIIQQEPIEETR